MADRKDMVDGFTAFQAARRANRSVDESGDETIVRARQSTPTKRGEAPGSRIGRTALPTQKELVCFHCEAEFPVVGAQSNVMCPECREWLHVKEISVKSKGWAAEMNTAGSLIIQADGVVTGGQVVANNIVIRGKLEGGKHRATHQLEIHKGALFDLDCIEARDLVIHRGAEFAIEDGQLDGFRDIDVYGALSGNVQISGRFVVHGEGLFRGALTAKALDVAEGGFLEAETRLGE